MYSEVETEEEKEGGGGDGGGGRHTGSVVNEQSFEPNMLSPRRSPYSSCQGAAHVRPRRFPVCQTGKPGQTFELAQTVWYPTTVASENPRIPNMLLYVGTVLFVRSTTRCLGSRPRNFLPLSYRACIGIEHSPPSTASVHRFIGCRSREVFNPSCETLDALPLRFFRGRQLTRCPLPECAIEFCAPHARTHTHAQSMHLDESGYAYALNVSGVER